MRELREEYLDVVQWTINDNNINRQIIDAAKVASAVEDALDSLQNVLSPYGGLSFSSQQEEVKRVTDIALVMDDCRKYLADEYREYIDGPLRKRFNTLMDELATVDVKNFRVKNTLGIKGVEYRGKEHWPFETEVAELTLSDYVGLGIGTVDSQGIRHKESVSGMAELFEKEYNYYIEANILDESVGLKEFLESYIPREFMYAKDASDVQKVLQSVWEGLVISRYIDSARGKTLITQDNLTTSEAEMNGVIGTVDLVFTVTGAGIYTKAGSGGFLKGMFLATSENMMANATYTTLDNAGYGEYGVAAWLCMEVAGAYFLHRLGKGSGSSVDELLAPKKVNEEVFLESGNATNPCAQIKGNSYDINKLQKTQPYTYPDVVSGMKETIVQNGPNSLPPIEIRVHHEQVLVVDGHHRLEAFSQLGYDRVPIKYLHSSQLGKNLPDGSYYRTIAELLEATEICN